MLYTVNISALKIHRRNVLRKICGRKSTTFVECIDATKKECYTLHIEYNILYSNKKLAETVHHVSFMIHQGVCIPVQGNRRILVAEDLGQGLDVHSALKCSGCKGMS